MEQLPAEEATVVQRLLTSLVRTVCRYPVPVLLASLTLVGVSLWLFATQLRYQTQRSDLLSADKECQQRWRRYLAEFGDDDDMVVVVQGADQQRMKDALEAMAEQVRHHPEHLDHLFYKADLRNLNNRALLCLSTEQIETIRSNLQAMDQLLRSGTTGWQFFLNLYVLSNEAVLRLNKLAPGEALSARDEQFFTQFVAMCRSATATLRDQKAYRSPWGSMMAEPPADENPMVQPRYFFSGDKELAFLLVRPVKEAGSFTGAQKSVETLREIVAGVRADYPDLAIGLTGMPVLENDEMTASQHDTRLASWLALAGVGLLYILVFRGLRCPLLIVGTLLVGTAWALGWLTLTVGHLNILSATFLMMLIGMGDYGVLWLTRYEQERRQGADVATALWHTARDVGPGILTAAVTAALAFFAAMLADFHAVTELGWIAGGGVLLCAVSCFTILPALLTLVDRRNLARGAWRVVRADERTTHHASRPTPSVWLPFLARRPGWVIAAGVGLTAVLACCALRVGYDHNLLHLQAEGLDSVKWELTLMDHTTGASWHSLSYTDTPEEALALKARFEQLPAVSRVDTVAALVPADQDRKLSQLRDLQQQLSNLPPRDADLTSKVSTTPASLRRELTALEKLLDSRRTGAPPLLAEVRGSVHGLSEQLNVTPEAEATERLAFFDNQLRSDLAANLRRLQDVSTPAPITVDDLPPPLRERFVGRNGKWLLQVYSKDNLWDYGPLQEFVQQVRSVDPEATGQPFGTLEGLRVMKNGFQWAGLYALIAIVLVLFADFRSVRRMLLALAPLGMGAALATGIMGLCGLSFNPANIIALPLIVGVGVNYGVYVLHDYRTRKERGDYTLSFTTGRAILVAALATILGFGSLMISSHRGLVGLGMTLSLGVACCTVMALVVLPAVLRVASNWGAARRIPVSEPQRQRSLAA